MPDRQQTIEFDRIHRDRLVTDAPLPAGHNTSSASMRALLVELHCMIGQKDGWRIGIPRLAERLKLSISATGRALAALRAINVVETARTGRTGLFSIRWSALDQLATTGDPGSQGDAGSRRPRPAARTVGIGPPPGISKAASDPGDSPPQPAPPAHETASDSASGPKFRLMRTELARSDSARCAIRSRKVRDQIAQGARSTLPQTSPEIEPSPSTYATAAAGMVKHGIKNVGGTIANARSNGLPAVHVVALCDHFAAMPCKPGVGLLVYRIAHDLPGCDPSAGWPEQPAPSQPSAASRALQIETTVYLSAKRRRISGNPVAADLVEATISKRLAEAGLERFIK